jgi:ACS family hexuronate transporter-like MFS transporter
MSERFGVNIKEIGLPMITVYLLADIGSVAGGWQSSWLLKRGWSPNAARKTAMLTCALCVVPVVAAPLVQGNYHLVGGWSIEAKWIAVLLIGVAAAAHQVFSANMFTLASDMFPRGAVGSVVGIGGMAGAIGGMFIAKAAGYILQWTGSYLYLFIIADSTYLIALLLIQMLAPRLDEANVERV